MWGVDRWQLHFQMLFEEKVAMLVGLQLWYFEDEQPPYMVDLLDLHFQNILPPQTQVSVLKNKCYIVILTIYFLLPPLFSSFPLFFGGNFEGNILPEKALMEI